MPRQTGSSISPEDEAALRREGDLIRWTRAAAGLNSRDDQPGNLIRCPTCGAAPRQACTNPQGRRLTTGMHSQREDGAQPQNVPEPKRPVGAWPATRRQSWMTPRWP